MSKLTTEMKEMIMTRQGNMTDHGAGGGRAHYSFSGPPGNPCSANYFNPFRVVYIPSLYPGFHPGLLFVEPFQGSCCLAFTALKKFGMQEA